MYKSLINLTFGEKEIVPIYYTSQPFLGIFEGLYKFCKKAIRFFASFSFFSVSIIDEASIFTHKKKKKRPSFSSARSC